MLEMKEDKKISWSETDFQYSKNIIWCKWYDNKSVLLLATSVDGMSGTYNVMRRTKGSTTKIPVSCSNIIKFFNNDMVGVNIMDRKTAVYRLDCKSKYLFYLGMLFDFIDVAIVKVTLFARNWYTVFVRDFSPPVGQTCENLINYPCAEKSQTTCPSSRKSKKDAIITRMKD